MITKDQLIKIIEEAFAQERKHPTYRMTPKQRKLFHETMKDYIKAGNA